MCIFKGGFYVNLKLHFFYCFTDEAVHSDSSDSLPETLDNAMSQNNSGIDESVIHSLEHVLTLETDADSTVAVTANPQVYW